MMPGVRSIILFDDELPRLPREVAAPPAPTPFYERGIGRGVKQGVGRGV